MRHNSKNEGDFRDLTCLPQSNETENQRGTVKRGPAAFKLKTTKNKAMTQIKMTKPDRLYENQT